MSEIAELEFAAVETAPVTGHGLKAWMQEARELIRLAGPLVFTQLAQMAVLTTDVVMVGRLGSTPLAQAALGNTVFFFTWLIGCGPVAAVAPMIAHILGARPNDRAGVRAVVRMGFWAVLILSLPLMGLLLFTRAILLALDQTDVLAAGAGLFTGIICLGLPGSLAFQVLRNFATAMGRPQSALWVMGATVLFNAIGDYSLIFGHFGAPRLGLAGAAMASACSYTFSFVAMLAVVYATPALRAVRIFRRFQRVHWEKLAEIFRLGMPIGLTMIFEAMLFNSATLLMGTFGTAYVAAHQIAINVPSITFMVPLGIGMGANVRVGLAAGAGDGEGVRRAGLVALVLGAGFMCFSGIFLCLFPHAIASLYFADPKANAQVIALAASFLYVAAAFQVFDGLQVVGAMSLRGLKDARAPMWIAGASYWLVGFPTCFALGFWAGMKGFGIWIGLAVALLVAASAMCCRFWYLASRR